MPHCRKARARFADYDAAAAAVFEQVKDFAPAVIVGVRSPEGTWTAAYGAADLAAGTAATTDMHQRIASITKTFVGTVVLQLADEGKLSLDDPVDDYVPRVPNGSHTAATRCLSRSTAERIRPTGGWMQPTGIRLQQGQRVS